MEKWPRIAVVVGGSITVPCLHSDGIQASDQIMFSLNENCCRQVEGIPNLNVAVPQKWMYTHQFDTVTTGITEESEHLLLSQDDENRARLSENMYPIKCAAVCLDIDARQEMRILLK